MRSADRIQEFIFAYLTREAQARGLGPVERREGLHMVDSGLLDSHAFLALLVELEATFDVQMDLSDADPADYLTVSGLSRLAAASIAGLAR